MIQNKRIMRAVEPSEWAVADVLTHRRDRLLNGLTPAALLVDVVAQGEAAARRGDVRVGWKDCEDLPGKYAQATAQVPLSESTFDQLFNGRCGYRAQYYLSPEEGILFNRDILEGLLPALGIAYARSSLSVPFDFIERSIRAPHSKIWVFNDKEAFNAAGADTLNPARWVESLGMLGRRAPLPSDLLMDVKGSLIDQNNDDFYVSPLKVDRAHDLFKCGFT